MLTKCYFKKFKAKLFREIYSNGRPNNLLVILSIFKIFMFLVFDIILEARKIKF